MRNTDYRHRSIALEPVDLHVVEAGDPGDPPVVLLHGFPEFWYGWHRQISPLARAGFRVLAPDQRGYNESGKPEGVDDYRLDRLAEDIVGVMDVLSLDRIRLVGHDWGGAVAWWLALTEPERIDRLAILNSPHPVAFQSYLETHPSQILKSWYMFLFQLPGLPERTMGLADGAVPARTLRRTSRPGTFSADELEAYRQAWAKPDAWRGMINWYRALFRHPPPSPPASWEVDVPTLILWGERDRFLSVDLAELSAEQCRDVRLEQFENASHWLQHEYSAAINRMLVEFFGTA